MPLDTSVTDDFLIIQRILDKLARRVTKERGRVVFGQWSCTTKIIAETILPAYNRSVIVETMRYNFYLKSDDWKEKRLKRIQIDKTCKVCKSKKSLHVHHKTYKNFGREEMNDLVVLCESCHRCLHAIRKGLKIRSVSLNEKQWKKLYQYL